MARWATFLRAGRHLPDTGRGTPELGKEESRSAGEEGRGGTEYQERAGRAEEQSPEKVFTTGSDGTWLWVAGSDF